jgi:hypothetical protein
VVADFQFKIMAVRKRFETRGRRLDIQKLPEKRKQEEFKLELKNRFSALSHFSDMNVESTWKEVKDSYLNTSEKILGFRNRVQKEWKTKNTWEEIENRKKAKNRLNQCRTHQQEAKGQAEYTEINRSKEKCEKRQATVGG